ncbi:TetR/AcrR family transcriptional regulator [Azospirillum sp. YIM DDC1]|uniref:TetR/AcrR family transcriptional regulator n=2 Tax=Azospirillum aestuarii TaxID=2802052 RepID=A0ABS1I7U3_9PROT|nr:TetR/AcrR family transcriptional regulator [Azospirillum aestuarii]
MREGVSKPGSEPECGEGSAPLFFEEVLAMWSRERTRPKRERTRYMLLSIVARHLRTSPGKLMTVEALLDEAGLSRGTFYNYFKDMDECAAVLVNLFFEHVTYRRSASKGPRSSYDAILDANTVYCRAYEANAGVYSLFSELATRDPEVLRMRERMNSEWVDRIIAVVARRRGRPFSEDERSKFEGVLRLMIAMTIESLRERFVHGDALLCRSFPTADSLAKALSDQWYKAMEEFDCPTQQATDPT